MSSIFGRKADHLDLAATADVGFRKTTLLECVELVHDCLPELEFDEVQLGCDLLGKPLRAPIVIAAMTGGTERAKGINLALAEIAEDLGLGFGLGSQRAMFIEDAATASYRVREAAPTSLILGNIGGVQAAQMHPEEVLALVEAVGADALCIHLNPAMELIQADGDRDFRGILDRLSYLTHEFAIPIVVKETGCGISPSAASRLAAIGVRHVDVSGAGGTSWVAVEAERASERRRSIGETFREWGIPTAASIVFAAQQGLETVIATGGIASGLDAARALALGASAVGIARPVLMAFERGGRMAAREYLLRVQTELRIAMLLTGSRDLEALRVAPRILEPRLLDWLELGA